MREKLKETTPVTLKRYFSREIQEKGILIQD
jgi:hypothetical protein